VADRPTDRRRDRQLYEWNPSVTLMRTSAEENARLGKILADKANAATGPVAFLLPLRGTGPSPGPAAPLTSAALS
jgi:uncharacterized protein (UPF0261 family)